MGKKLSEITRQDWIAYRWTEITCQGSDRVFIQDGERTPDEARQAMEDWDVTAEERGKPEGMGAKINISEAHAEALAVIMSEAYPYADGRNLAPVFEGLIEGYLLRENGRLGEIINGEYKTK